MIVEYEQDPVVYAKVCAARKKLHLTDKQCPCAPKEEGRGCVGPVCLAEIYAHGRCKCGAYHLTKETKDDTVQPERRDTK